MYIYRLRWRIALSNSWPFRKDQSIPEVWMSCDWYQSQDIQIMALIWHGWQHLYCCGCWAHTADIFQSSDLHLYICIFTLQLYTWGYHARPWLRWTGGVYALIHWNRIYCNPVYNAEINKNSTYACVLRCAFSESSTRIFTSIKMRIF